MAYIKAISYYLPPDILSNELLAGQFPEWSVEKISSKTGIRERHIAAADICSSDLAYESVKMLFTEHNINPGEIDFILLCTQSPDYFLPTTACLLQDRLNIPTTAGALDFNLGCSGFVYGLSLANSLIKAGEAENVLLITAETYSKFINPQDKSVRTIFGDAAAACLISKSENNTIGPFIYGTDGSGGQNLIVKEGGMRTPTNLSSSEEKVDEYGNVHNAANLYMNGGEIFIFTLKSVPSLISNLLQKANLSMDDIGLFVLHQANKYMLEALRKKIHIPEDKLFIYMEDVGNTVSSTIPIALYHALKEKRIFAGIKVMVVGFGVGYSWAGTIMQF